MLLQYWIKKSQRSDKAQASRQLTSNTVARESQIDQSKLIHAYHTHTESMAHVANWLFRGWSALFMHDVHTTRASPMMLKIAPKL